MRSLTANRLIIAPTAVSPSGRAGCSEPCRDDARDGGRQAVVIIGRHDGLRLQRLALEQGAEHL